MKKDSDIPELSKKLLDIARFVESGGINKLNCIFIAARRLSLPSVDVMIREQAKLGLDDPKV
jgi:hypothetical protein